MPRQAGDCAISILQKTRPAPGSARPRGFDAPGSVAFVVAMFVVVTLSTLVTPALVESWVARTRWSETTIGLIVALEMVGLAAGSSSALLWQKRADLRLMTLIAIGCYAAGSLEGWLGVGLGATCFARLLCGVGAGLGCGVQAAFIANVRHPEKIISITVLIQLISQSLVLGTAHHLTQRWGAGALFALLALLAMLPIPFLRWLPSRWPGPDAARAADPATGRSSRGIPQLLAFLPYGLFQIGIFSFLARFGQEGARLDPGTVVSLIGLSVVGGALGPIGSYLLGDRIGLGPPIAGCLLVLAAVLLGMSLPGYSGGMFLVYISLLQAGWTFLNTYLYAALIAANNELTAAAATVTLASGAAGAAVVGWGIEHLGLRGALCIALLSIGLIAALTLPFIVRSPNQAEVS